MKRIGFLSFIVTVCLASAAWAQNQPRSPQNRPAAPKVKSWELSHHPEGTWVQMADVNDFGIAIGIGDVAGGSTHTLAVPVFGPDAGRWLDLGTLGGPASGGRTGSRSTASQTRA
jgi:hypothetical protein